jgi:Mn2+/Fe2+ NRAMP family transporter
MTVAMAFRKRLYRGLPLAAVIVAAITAIDVATGRVSAAAAFSPPMIGVDILTAVAIAAFAAFALQGHRR